MREIFATIAFLFVLVGETFAQIPGQEKLPRQDSLSVVVEINGSGATNGSLRSMWSYSQEWGRYTQYKQGEGSIYTKLSYSWHNKNNLFSLNVGAAIQMSTDRNQMMLHEAYLSGKIWEVGYTIGREAFTPIDQKNNLGLGTYFLSNNARPVNKIGVGFFDYWAIPGIKNWIELKGAFYFGIMPNEDNPTFTKNVLLQEKFLYLRLGHYPVKPYIGLMHSVFMGGTMANGTIIPVDFWASCFGLGSQKMHDAGFIGEYYNAAGGHQGMWDLGLNFDFEPLSADLYYQRPFYDKTAINLFDFGYCRDFTVGAIVNFKKFKPIKGVCLEYFTTMWQGGDGIADPDFVSTGPEKVGEEIALCQNEVTPDLLRKYLAKEIGLWEAEHGHPLAQDECSDFLVKYTMPPGWSWGNRSPYLENVYYYPQGWSVDGLGMGYPIMMTNKTMEVIAPGYNFFTRFSNVRMWALNIGLNGEIIPGLDWKAKITFTDNYGDYREQYYDRLRFYIKRPNYYFPETGLKEFYTGLWFDYHFKSFTFRAALNYDFGDMYQCFTGRLGVRMTFDAFARR